MNLVFYCSTWFKVNEFEIGDHLNFWYYELARNIKILPFMLMILKDFTNDEKFTLQIITDKELENLENPQLIDEEERIDNILSSLSDSKFEKLCKSIDLKFISAEPIKENMGMVNSMFLIQAQDNNNKMQVELILRITEQHTFFTQKKTTNEVAILNYLKNTTKIPVPKILSFSNDKLTSVIDCEYILMEKVKGLILGEVIDQHFQDVNNLPDKLIDQMLDIFKELKSIKLNENLIGGFNLNMSITSSTQFGPNIGPCHSYFEFIDRQLEWIIKEMNKIRVYKKAANELENFRKNLNQVIIENPELDYLNFEDEMTGLFIKNI